MAKPNVISKEDLIRHAKQSLTEKGIEKFTLRGVAEAAGVTQGTVYYHFRTKEQLLLEMVQDISVSSWRDISEPNEFILEQAIASAKSRCTYDSPFHKLFFSLVASSFTNPHIRDQLGEIIAKENQALTDNLPYLWAKSPIEGVSSEGWGILLNAVVDGLAIQTLLQKDFPVDTVYQELEHLIKGLHALPNNQGGSR